jgi:hypothetical protein
MEEIENWRPVPIEGFSSYEVSDLGRIRRLGRILAFKTNAQGYKAIGLRKPGVRKWFSVHQLTLLAFVGPRPEGQCCCHNDGNPANNRLGNLRWDTYSANMLDKHRHGRMPTGERNGAKKYPERLKRGTDVHLAKLTDDAVRDIRARYKPRVVSQQSLADEYGVSQVAIGLIVRNKTWTHVSEKSK